jgi:acetylornithine/succinyldiaminopimelate/putrescine aminotransferase
VCIFKKQRKSHCNTFL